MTNNKLTSNENGLKIEGEYTMQEPIIIDDQEMVEFIQTKVKLSQEDIFAVLDAEMEFLKLKGVIEE